MAQERSQGFPHGPSQLFALLPIHACYIAGYLDNYGSLFDSQFTLVEDEPQRRCPLGKIFARQRTTITGESTCL